MLPKTMPCKPSSTSPLGNVRHFCDVVGLPPQQIKRGCPLLKYWELQFDFIFTKKASKNFKQASEVYWLENVCQAHQRETFTSSGATPLFISVFLSIVRLFIREPNRVSWLQRHGWLQHGIGSCSRSCPFDRIVPALTAKSMKPAWISRWRMRITAGFTPDNENAECWNRRFQKPPQGTRVHWKFYLIMRYNCKWPRVC